MMNAPFVLSLTKMLSL